MDWRHLGETGASDRQTAALEELGRERYGWAKEYPGPAAVTWLDGTVSLRRVDDSPTPHTIPAPYDHPNLAEAEIIVDEAWPEMGAQLRRILQAIYIYESEKVRTFKLQTGCSCGPAGDRVSMEIQTTINGAVGMLEGVVHELGHNKLKYFGVSLYHWERLMTNEAPSIERIDAGTWIDDDVGSSSDELLYLSPIRKDKPRPLGACWSAHYSYLHVCELLERIVDAGVLDYGQLGEWIEVMRRRIYDGMALLEYIQPTIEGKEFFAGQTAWADRLLGWEV